MRFYKIKKRMASATMIIIFNYYNNVYFYHIILLTIDITFFRLYVIAYIVKLSLFPINNVKFGFKDKLLYTIKQFSHLERWPVMVCL